MKRKAIDFLMDREIHVLHAANGKFWAQIVHNNVDIEWELKECADSRQEAFDLACNRLDALAEAYVSEGEQEPEDDGSGVTDHARRNGVSGNGWL